MMILVYHSVVYTDKLLLLETTDVQSGYGLDIVMMLSSSSSTSRDRRLFGGATLLAFCAGSTRSVGKALGCAEQAFLYAPSFVAHNNSATRNALLLVPATPAKVFNAATVSSSTRTKRP